MRSRMRMGFHRLLFCILLAGISMLLMPGAQRAFAEVAEPEPQDFYLSGGSGELKRESAVNDFAGVYTPEQIAAFEEQMCRMRDEYDCNVVAFIIDNPEWNSSEVTAPENVSEVFLNLDGHRSTVVLWLNICRENRALYVLGYGTAERKIMDNESDELAGKLQDYVRRQQDGEEVGNLLYVSMMNAFIADADAEMRKPYFFLSWWFQLLIGVIVGLIVVLCLVRNVGGKMTSDGRTYMNKTFSQLLGKQDVYTHTTYVRRKKSSNSGRSGGGGHSHSRGGGRF